MRRSRRRVRSPPATRVTGSTRRGAFWPGPYFWPYAYHDETFWLWPSSYDAMFWSYGYDDLLYGIYRSYDPGLAIGSRSTRRARLAPQVPDSLLAWCGQAARVAGPSALKCTFCSSESAP